MKTVADHGYPANDCGVTMPPSQTIIALRSKNADIPEDVGVIVIVQLVGVNYFFFRFGAFFFAAFFFGCLIADWAAANLATGTR